MGRFLSKAREVAKAGFRGFLVIVGALWLKFASSKAGISILKSLNLDRENLQWPSFKQWSRLFTILGYKEKIILGTLAFLFIISFSVFSINFYFSNTEIKPARFGEYSEAEIGQPRFINPLFASINDADRDLTQLIFSGLFKYDESGKIVPDLADNFEIKDGGKTYEITLKKGVKWHDGKPFSSDDVVFTINAIQDPLVQSPQRINWQGVKIERIDDYRVRIALDNPYVPFIENLTQAIVPKHIWQDVMPQNFTLADFNFKPIGTGPFRAKKFEKDKLGFIKSYTLVGFDDYYGKRPYLEKINFYFYGNAEEALASVKNGKTSGINAISSKNLNFIKNEGLNVYSMNLPRYYSVFFNQNQSKALADYNVRLALSYATDKKEILDKVIEGKGVVTDSPIPPMLFGNAGNIKIYDFSPEYAKGILDKAGWQDANSDGWRERIIMEKKTIGRKTFEEKKEEIPLEITIATLENSELENVADLLKSQWEKIGVKVNVEIYDQAEIQQEIIRPRNYQVLLFGEVLGVEPDPFSFWHSSQKKDPGLNLALYENREVDKILEEARQNFDSQIRFQKYERFQQIITNDVPAIFLYSPYYLYGIDKQIKGLEVKTIADPSKRFAGIENWYIKTKRTWK